jgi:hypothetical protein
MLIIGVSPITKVQGDRGPAQARALKASAILEPGSGEGEAFRKGRPREI